jgi:hypothetical protein
LPELNDMSNFKKTLILAGLAPILFIWLILAIAFMPIALGLDVTIWFLKGISNIIIYIAGQASRVVQYARETLES